jgi:hypothetical protein
MLRVKDGVRFHSPAIAMSVAVSVMAAVAREFSIELVITGAVERHEFPSLHVTGAALDVRTRDMILSKQVRFAREIRIRLGDGYDVVLESDHLHVEYDPA